MPENLNNTISGLAVIKAMFAAAMILTAGVAAVLIISGGDDTTDDFMSYFSNYDDLARYLDDAYASIYGPNASGRFYFGLGMGSAEQGANGRFGSDSIEYSKTNVQVEGVDEADIVKTNGELIFVASWDSVAIIKAYPPADMTVLSYVSTSDFFDSSTVRAYIQGIYIAGNELILILSCYDIYPYNTTEPALTDYAHYYVYYQNGATVIAVIDVSDPVSPSLKQKFQVSGYPITTRMIGSTIYAISQFYILKVNDAYPLPEIATDESSETVSPRDIYYDPNTTLPSSFLNILAVDVDGLRYDSLSIIADYSSTIYMSESSLYLTFQKWKYYWGSFAEPVEVSDSSICTTTIYKIEVDGLTMAVTARGDVKGYPLNQFALDEHDGYLRIATTDGWWDDRTNAVFVLDDSLAIVGSLEDIAPNESIYSARFVKDTLYLVTFRQIDPFFVIDLTDPANPRLLGELELPGFSTYLHPVDDEQILGIGIEKGCVKISMFDISDPTAPVEKFRYVTEDNSYSEANWDHKAVLFDAKKELLVIPATEMNFTYIDEYNYSYEYTQGAYVFKVSVDEGIELRGIIEHGSSYVRRALYIGEYLYTISECFVKANLISDLSPVGALQYHEPQYYDDWYGIGYRTF